MIYTGLGAPSGQAEAHAPQSRHSSGLMVYLPSCSEIADIGQTSIQEPHAIHESVILCGKKASAEQVERIAKSFVQTKYILQSQKARKNGLALQFFALILKCSHEPLGVRFGQKVVFL